MTRPRRTWWTRPGSRTLEAIAQLNDLVDSRRAGTRSVEVQCCHLAVAPTAGCYTRCINTGGGYWIQYWWCCRNGMRYQCQECTPDSTCQTTNVICSNIVATVTC
jgi:hypothetical protein